MKNDYEKLYKYCTSAKVHGKLYKEKLKKLQQLTLKGLKENVKEKSTNS